METRAINSGHRAAAVLAKLSLALFADQASGTKTVRSSDLDVEAE